MDYFKEKTKRKVLMTLVASVGLILYWKGIWDMTYIFILPDNPFWQNIASIILGLVILLGSGKIFKQLGT